MQKDPQEQYSQLIKKNILKKLADTNAEDIQILEDIMRQLKEHRSKKNQDDPLKANELPQIGLDKRKLGEQTDEQHKLLKGSKQRTLTEFKLKPNPIKTELQVSRETCSWTEKQRQDFLTVVSDLAKQRRSNRLSKKKIGSLKMLERPQRHPIPQSSYTHLHIHDNYYYLKGFKRPKQLKVNFCNPLQKIADINYDLDSDEEYNELKGQELNQDDGQEEQDQQNAEQGSQNGFCVSDGHLSEDQMSSDGDQRPQNQSNNILSRRQWVYSHKIPDNVLPQHCEINVITSQIPLNVRKSDQKAQFLRKNETRMDKLNQLCHGNTRVNIIQSFKKDLGINKEQALLFINTCCTKRVIDKKTIYQVKQIVQQSKKSNRSKKSNKSNK